LTKKDHVTFKNFNPKKNKKKKVIIWSIIIIIVAVLIYFSGTIISNLKKMFGDDSSIISLIKKSDNTKLKGEEEGRVNFLLLGMAGGYHDGGILTDTIIVLSLNTKTNKAAMLSIPRDLYIQIPQDGYTKINAVFSIGESKNTENIQNLKSSQEEKISETSGADLAKETVSSIIGIPIHYYMRMDFEGFKKIVDTLGGVDVYVKEDLYDPYYPTEDYKYQIFQITKGVHHLDGATALMYVRSRETTSDFDRSKRQQQVLASIKDKAEKLSILNIGKITELSKILGDSIKTDLTIAETKHLLELLKKVDMNNIINKVLDNSSDSPLEDGNINGAYVLLPKLGMNNYSAIQAIAKTIFGNENATEDSQIAVYNGSGVSGMAKNAADELSDLGYSIYSIDTYTTVLSRTTIVDLSNGKYPKTIEALKDKYQAIENSSLTISSQADIILIIGKDQI